MMSPNKTTVLIVDDEPLKRITLQIELGDAGYDVLEAADARIALRVMEGRPVDIVVTDLRMPGMDGIGFLDEIKRRWPETDVILMTAYGTVDTAVSAIKRGAYDYITKPFRTETLLEKLDRLRAYRSSERGSASADEEAFGRIVGRSVSMRRLIEQIRAAGRGDEAVLIVGEEGTGKTLIAETIHQLGARRSGPFLRINCELLQDHSTDAELFGSATEPGRPGRLQQAIGGSLLIQNVDRLSPPLQAKLLNVIEGGGISGNDGNDARSPAGVRLITTTKIALLDRVRRGEFREDLFYRLTVRTLNVPPLRDRREDIPALARAFIRTHGFLAKSSGSQPIEFSTHALDLLMAYHWPGNVMELEHVVEQALTRCGGQDIRPEHLPPYLCESDPAKLGVSVPEVGLGLNQTVADVERTLIEAALRQSSGNQARAAQILRIPRTTLRDKMTKYGLVGEASAP